MTRRSRGRWSALLALLLAGLCLVGPAPSAQAQLFGGASPFPAPAPAAVPAPGTSTATSTSTAPAGDSAGEFRGLWVDVYRDGLKTPAQVDQLLADARRANVNALLQF